MFDIGALEMLALAVAALLIFGPDRLPQMAAKAGRTIRQVREFAAGARRDLRQHLGPELADLNLADLHPRTFVRKNVFDGDLGLDDGPSPRPPGSPLSPPPAFIPPLWPGERPPYDPDTT